MQNNGTGRRACILLAAILLLACSERGTPPQTVVDKQVPPQPGMHVYKDPLTGEFISQPANHGESAQREQAQPGQRENNLENNRERSVKPTRQPAQEYESPAGDGSILLDLPSPYSEPKE